MMRRFVGAAIAALMLATLFSQQPTEAVAPTEVHDTTSVGSIVDDAGPQVASS